MIEYRDLREWLALIDATGELRRVDEVHWDLQIGALTEVVSRRRDSPALLFDRIPDYRPGYRLLVNQLASPRRLALTWGLTGEVDRLRLVHAWRDILKRMTPLAPTAVPTGPVTQNVQDDAAVDMRRFPAPKWHRQDGGRYLGTAAVVITRDPDSGWVNAGVYRVILHENGSLGIQINFARHGRSHLESYRALGKPCPIVISFGHEPLLYFFAASAFRSGESELDYVGGMRGEPLEVLVGERTGLPIPARSELVIEGEIWPGETELEGPFGEFTGYYAGGRGPEPVIRVKRVLHRDDPIVCGEHMAPPPSSLTFYRAITKSATIWNSLEEGGVPDVRGVWCHESGATRFFNVVSIKQRYPGHARQAGLVASQCAEGVRLGRYVVVVDEDIDPTNLEDVVWAMSTRSDPERDIDIITRSFSTGLDPAVRHTPGKRFHSSRAIITACKPYEWYDEFPATSGLTLEEQAEVLRQFGHLLEPGRG